VRKEESVLSETREATVELGERSVVQAVRAERQVLAVKLMLADLLD
jgi:hypothetical protein